MSHAGRKLAKAAPLPKAALAAGATVMGGMFYWVVRDAKSRQKDARMAVAGTSSETTLTAATGTSSSGETLTTGGGAMLTMGSQTSLAAPTSSTVTASAPFLGSGPQPSAENVPSFVLAATGLDAEQKLQVALCRRQAWVRAAQLGPTLALCGYSACVLTEATGLAKLPRGSKLAVPLAGFVVGMTAGAYFGMMEGKPTMNAALMSKPIENAHMRRADRPKEEDALVSFIKSAAEPRQRAA